MFSCEKMSPGPLEENFGVSRFRIKLTDVIHHITQYTRIKITGLPLVKSAQFKGARIFKDHKRDGCDTPAL